MAEAAVEAEEGEVVGAHHQIGHTISGITSTGELAFRASTADGTLRHSAKRIGRGNGQTTAIATGRGTVTVTVFVVVVVRALQRLLSIGTHRIANPNREENDGNENAA